MTDTEVKANKTAAEDESAAVSTGQKNADGSELSIEDAFAQIRDLLAEMDQEDVTLEKSFENYEKGMKLIRYCNDKIDRVEKKVQKMNADGSLQDFEE